MQGNNKGTGRRGSRSVEHRGLLCDWDDTTLGNVENTFF